MVIIESQDLARSGFLDNAAKFGEPSVFQSVGIVPSRCDHFRVPRNRAQENLRVICELPASHLRELESICEKFARDLRVSWGELRVSASELRVSGRLASKSNN